VRWGCASLFSMSSPGLTKTSEAKSRSIGKRSAAVRPGDPVLTALVARFASFGLLSALGPGSRDGLSVHTVRDDSLRETGKLCRETSCPPWQALISFREHVRVRARSRAGATLSKAPCRSFAAPRLLSRCLPCHGGGSGAVRLQDASFPPAAAQASKASASA
jgi:hypothetical protein